MLVKLFVDKFEILNLLFTKCINNGVNVCYLLLKDHFYLNFFLLLKNKFSKHGYHKSKIIK